MCSERVEIIPKVWHGANFVEAHMSHFSQQAQYFVRVLRCGSAIFVAGAGNREVARCGGGECRARGRCLEGLESQNCLAGLLDACAPMELPAGVRVDFGDFGSLPQQSVLQECPSRVSYKSESECHARCPTKVSPTRGSKIVGVFVFEYVFAFGFVGSILLLTLFF